jgi:hypothetical protein
VAPLPVSKNADNTLWGFCVGCSHSDDSDTALAALLSRAFGVQPPIEAFGSWAQALAGDLHLYFEVNLPSPPSYRRWLRAHLEERAPIPYLLEAAKQAGDRLEGPTHADALLITPTTASP